MAKYVNVAKAARILGVSRARMQELIRTGELETFEGQVDVEQLRSKFPGLAFNESPIVERAQIIKDAAYGERLQKFMNPPADVLQALGSFSRKNTLGCWTNVEQVIPTPADHFH